MREKGIARKVETYSSSKTAFSEEDYLKISNRVREVINKLQDAFKTIQESTDPQIQAISQTKSTELQEKRQELERLEDMKDPKTVIAVLGATGEGKSSLINALLDQRNVLPTSGMRACTAVVVEVAQNVASDLFEADIEFRTKEEWIEECQCLTRDLTTDDGVLRTRSPDPGSDIFASYLKMMAVYGKIEENVIEERTDITEWLGRRKTITSSDPEDFREEVEKYIIQSQDGEDGLQYWPIVKVIHLRVPNCDVCSTGAVLVDLPGVQDFNRARENVTKEYLKSCKAVWVVAGIHRAIDDKTARDLLGENFRRQLLMDGNYGNVAFICSKTDDIEPSECTRINKKLGNQPEIDKLNSEISDMEKEKRWLSSEKRSYEKEKKEATKQIQQHKKVQENIKTEPRDDEKTTDMVNTPEQFAEQNEHLEEIHRKIYEHTNRMIEIEQEMAANRKKIKIICARARNTFATEEIKKDFKAGLKELKHGDNEDEEDTDRNEDDSLPVFCCSASEYKKLLDPSSEDGPPMVFKEMGDTQVPQLRNYVHQVTREKKHQEMLMMVRLLRRFVLDLQNIISNASLEKNVTEIYNEYVMETTTVIKKIIEELEKDIGKFFSKVRDKLMEGAEKAQMLAAETCCLWGRPQASVKRNAKTAAQTTGYPLKTYMAAVNRLGEFKSPKYGHIDFNKDLSYPITCQQTIVWDEVFNDEIDALFLREKTRTSGDMFKPIEKICERLAGIGCERLAGKGLSGTIREDIRMSVSDRLYELFATLKDTVAEEQKEISREITPHIQTCLIPTYLACCKEEGHGMFQRVKDRFCADIEASKKTMFLTAVQNIVQALDALKVRIVESVEVTRDGLQKDMKRYLEPMTDSTSDYGSLQSMLKSCVEILHETPWIQESHMETAGQTNALKPDPPKADSSGIHKRKLDFVENLGNLKRQKRGTECSYPRDLDWVLDVSKADYENQVVIQQRLKNNCADYGLEFFGQTPANGDCFFEAIASQLDRVGHPNSGQSGPLELRLWVSDYIRQNTSMQGPDGPVSLGDYVDEPLEEYCERMSKSGTWADHVVVMAMAHMLRRDIVIVTSSPSTNAENCLLFVNGAESNDRVPLLLGHLWEYHYQSLQPMH